MKRAAILHSELLAVIPVFLGIAAATAGGLILLMRIWW
jgi:hypothetical protein